MTEASDQDRISIAELARLGGVSRRTVRYYVQRGLIPAPLGTGRGSHYTQEHLDALIRVKALQERGLPLSQIAGDEPGVGGANKATPDGVAESPVEVAGAPIPRAWARVELAEGIELHLRERRATSAQLARIRQAVLSILEQADRQEED